MWYSINNADIIQWVLWSHTFTHLGGKVNVQSALCISETLVCNGKHDCVDVYTYTPTITCVHVHSIGFCHITSWASIFFNKSYVNILQITSTVQTLQERAMKLPLKARQYRVIYDEYIMYHVTFRHDIHMCTLLAILPNNGIPDKLLTILLPCKLYAAWYLNRMIYNHSQLRQTHNSR